LRSEIARERHGAPGPDEPGGLGPLGRRDEVRGAALVVVAPAPPVVQLLEVALDTILRRRRPVGHRACSFLLWEPSHGFSSSFPPGVESVAEVEMTTIGLLHPGEMGASVGKAAGAAGARVLWASEGRGTDTWARAAAAELDDAGTLGAVVAGSDVILAVCPPHAAREMASAVAGAGFRKLYVDANAVAPATSREIARIVEAAGATYVDGGLIGPPPDKPGTTRLYLSGPQAVRAAALFANSNLEAIVLPGELTAASAIKM